MSIVTVSVNRHFNELSGKALWYDRYITRRRCFYDLASITIDKRKTFYMCIYVLERKNVRKLVV